MAFDLGGGSSAKQVQISSGGGRVFYGKGAVNTESGSFALGKGATYTEGGGVNIGAKGTLKTGTDLSGAQLKGATINIGDAGSSETWANAFQQLFSGQQAQTASLLSALSPNIPNSSPPRAATVGDVVSSTKKKIIVGVLAAVVFAAVWFLFRRR